MQAQAATKAGCGEHIPANLARQNEEDDVETPRLPRVLCCILEGDDKLIGCRHGATDDDMRCQ